MDPYKQKTLKTAEESKALKSLNVIGLMSGTSVDSIDAACIRVGMQLGPLWLSEFAILGTLTLEFEPGLRSSLLNLQNKPLVKLETLCHLNREFGSCFAEAAMNLIDQLKRQNIEVDLIASHGQTVCHIPPTPKESGATLQIGEPSIIAEQTAIEVVADFRQADMAAGGHGAPLVPFADRLLFQDSVTPRAIQNIGGIANLTALPTLEDSSCPIMAFDTGPGNMIIDAMMEELFQLPFDPGGEVASCGKLNTDMLEKMLEHSYFTLEPPKSTGRELFGKPYALSLIDQHRDQLSPEDMIATATHFTSITIVDAYRRFVLPHIQVKEVIVGGGGSMNMTLMQTLKDQFQREGILLKRHEEFGIPDKYKEAIAFAILGYATKMRIPNNIPSCTGASHPVILGVLIPRHA